MIATSGPLASFDLSGRVALVTGARREIARAIALGLAGAGARMAVHHAGEAEAAEGEAVAAEAGGGALPFAADFAQPGAAGAWAADVLAAMGRIDVLVLNASIEIVQPTAAIGPEEFARQIRINLEAPLELIQALLPGMQARGWGRILAIGSVQQLKPHPGMLVYAGTKAAQANWVRNLARQVGGSGVTVNNLAPGAILTARNRDALSDDGARAAAAARIPVGRLGRPDDLVGAALLLCSDAGRYITGVDLFVDGGMGVS